MDTTSRNKQMIELKEKMTLEEISKKFGISRQRVSQIIGKKKTSIRQARKKKIILTPEQQAMSALASFGGRSSAKKAGSKGMRERSLKRWNKQKENVSISP